MKKNWTLRVGVVLAALTLITSCFVGGTFAKYVTSETGTDSARVAAWGIKVVADGNAFSDAYMKVGGADGNKTCLYTESEATVKSGGAGTKVVAPGTTGEFASATITGTPEVAGTITRKATVKLVGWKDAADALYFPIVVSVNGKPVDFTGNITLAEYEQDIKDEIEACTKSFKPLDDVSSLPGADCVVTWEWPFETGANDSEKAANNVKDTYLGDQAAVGNFSTIEISIETIVAQVD